MPVSNLYKITDNDGGVYYISAASLPEAVTQFVIWNNDEEIDSPLQAIEKVDALILGGLRCDQPERMTIQEYRYPTPTTDYTDANRLAEAVKAMILYLPKAPHGLEYDTIRQNLQTAYDLYTDIPF